MIPRRKGESFACNAVFLKLQPKDRKMKELQDTRDLLSCLLYLATVKDINVKTVRALPSDTSLYDPFPCS